jgi:hypothetical protein
MLRSALLAFAVAGTLVVGARPAAAAGWPVTHKWSDQARPNDPTSGSFAYEYQAASVADAARMTKAGTAYDCADFAITVLCDFASKNGLEIVWTMPDPDNHGKVGQVSSTEARFTSPAQFARWSRGNINAMMVATMNTNPVSYSDWRAGDVVMMRWNQLGVNNPFYPRDVWHTYFTGIPGKLLFYGDEIGEDNHPAPIAATKEGARIDEVQGHGEDGPAVYGHSPRRWKMIDGNIVPPQTPLASSTSIDAPEHGKVTATALNLRSGPSTSNNVLAVAHAGDTLTVEGQTDDGWLRVRRADGSIAYAKADYATVASAKPDYTIATDNVTPTPLAQPVDAAPEQPRTGITDALGNLGGN